MSKSNVIDERPARESARVSRRAMPPAPLAPLAFLGVTVILLALSFRAPVLSAPPLIDAIRASTGISSTAAGLLTTIPVVCFGLVAPLAPALARRFGMERVLAGVVLTVILGILVRTATPIPMLFGGTVILGAGIAIGNVILPGFIKREAPHRIGPMTSLYSMAISGSGAMGAGLTVPIQRALDLSWRGALGVWAVAAVVGLMVLIPWLLHARSKGHVRARHQPVKGIWRDPLAWQVTIFMGSQSLVFFSTAAWLPSFFIDHGMSEQRAGFMLSIPSIVGVAGSFIAPLLANRRPHQQHLVVISFLFCGIGISGLLIAPVSLAVLWVVLFGFGSGMTLSIALTLIGLRSPDALHAAELSSMAQSVGYLLAAVGPLAIGFAYDRTGGWTLPIALLLASLIPLLLSGLGAGRNLLIGQGPDQR
jgi:MFS transporter, CP family, cyanate transporter